MTEKILFVDDEPNVLQSIKRSLRKLFDIETAESGHAALELLQSNGPYAVLVSDMQMPEMNGAELLSRAMKLVPSTVRIMLTGNADQQTAIDAINEGSILRFLNKPTDADQLAKAVNAGLEQHRLIVAEQELLEQTLRGSVRALSEVLALTNPEVFGRSMRLKTRMNAISKAMQLSNAWELEAAALLSQIGCVSLPHDLVRKKSQGVALTEEETMEFSSHTAAGAELLGSIPRLERVAEAVRYQEKYFDGSGSPTDDLKGDDLPIGARILRVVLDLDAYESSNDSPEEAFEQLRQRANLYCPDVMQAIATVSATAATACQQTVAIASLRDDLVLAANVYTSTGTLLVAKGQPTTQSVRRHLMNYHTKGLIDDVVDVVQAEGASPAPA